MTFDIDIAIVLGFLLITLAVGLSHGRKVTTISDYALGGRNFSTAALVATIVATWAAGDDFFVNISESYQHGLYFIFADFFGILTVLLLIGLFFVPRMSEFLGDLSIAESMGKLYGNKVKIITSIAGCIGTSGMIAAQFSISGLLLEYTFGLSSVYGTILGALIVTSYSSFGGIKSVTFTDVIQFFMFGAILPTLAFFIFGTLGNTDEIFEVFSTNDNFNCKQIFDFTSHKSLYYLFLFFFIAIPSFDPAMFQRISMAKNTFQARKAFFIAAFSYAFFALMISWIGITSLVIYPDSPPDMIAKHIIMDYSYIGLKGLTLAGIIAMMMSTADSYINSTSVLFTHDFCSAAGIKLKNELFASRIISFILGGFALVLSLHSTNLLQLLITTKSFYMPVVSVPFIFTILGFRSSTKSVLIGMVAGIISVILWELFLRNDTVDSVVPGMFANIVFLFSSHYILNQPGGWVGIKDYSPVIKLRQKRKEKFRKIKNAILNFSFINFCKKNSPKEENIYLYFGMFSMFLTYFSIYVILPKEKEEFQTLINFIYPSVFFASTLLISYPIWLESLKKKALISVVWICSIFYILIIVGSLQVLITGFGKIQLMIFMLNLVVLSILTRWPLAILMIIVGPILSIEFFEWYSESYVFQGGLYNLQFAIAYLLLLMSVVLLIFFKPKQERLEKTEEDANYFKDQAEKYKGTTKHFSDEADRFFKAKQNLENQLEQKSGDLKDTEKYLKDKLKLMQIEVEKVQEMKNEFIRNVPHESNAPMTAVLSLSEVLHSCYDKLDEGDIKQALKDIVRGGERLKSYVDNIADLSKLSSLSYKLNMKPINLTTLVKQRPNLYTKIFADDKKQEFIFNIKEDIIIRCDEYYLTQAIDNLVSNAVQYGKGNPVTITLEQVPGEKIELACEKVRFEIKDQGIGIAETELVNIFNTFTVSSKTKTIAGGRGVGLALCEKIIKAHKGEITCKSDGKTGSTFSFVIPGFVGSVEKPF